MENMDGTTIGVITTVTGALSAAIGTLWKSQEKRRDAMETRWTTKLDECEHRHEQCEERAREQAKELQSVNGRLQRLEGFYDAQNTE